MDLCTFVMLPLGTSEQAGFRCWLLLQMLRKGRPLASPFSNDELPCFPWRTSLVFNRHFCNICRVIYDLNRLPNEQQPNFILLALKADTAGLIHFPLFRVKEAGREVLRIYELQRCRIAPKRRSGCLFVRQRGMGLILVTL